MRIMMLKTQTGSLNGYRIDTYHAGVEYDMGLSDSHIDLARVFLREKWAVEVTQQPIKQEAQEAPKTQVKITRKRRK